MRSIAVFGAGSILAALVLAPLAAQQPGVAAPAFALKDITAWQAHHDSGLVVLAIDARDLEWTTRAVRRFVSEFALPFPVLLDYQGKVRRRYALIGLPALVFIGTNGVIRAVAYSSVPAVFQKELEAILLPL